MGFSTTARLKTPGPTALGQAAAEATEKASDSLLAHGVLEDMKRENAEGFKSLTTRWDKRWKMKDGDWKMKVRFVDETFSVQSTRED